MLRWECELDAVLDLPPKQAKFSSPRNAAGTLCCKLAENWNFFKYFCTVRQNAKMFPALNNSNSNSISTAQKHKENRTKIKPVDLFWSARARAILIPHTSELRARAWIKRDQPVLSQILPPREIERLGVLSRSNQPGWVYYLFLETVYYRYMVRCFWNTAPYTCTLKARITSMICYSDQQQYR